MTKTDKTAIILGVVVLASALSVIYSKYHSRLLFIEIQKKERELDQREIEWGQTQLELTTFAEQNRVELVAREKLKLVVPSHEKTVYLKPKP